MNGSEIGTIIVFQGKAIKIKKKLEIGFKFLIITCTKQVSSWKKIIIPLQFNLFSKNN